MSTEKKPFLPAFNIPQNPYKQKTNFITTIYFVSGVITSVVLCLIIHFTSNDTRLLTTIAVLSLLYVVITTPFLYLLLRRMSKDLEGACNIVETANREFEDKLYERTCDVREINGILQRENNMQTKLLERLEKYRLVANNSTEAMFFTDSDGVITEANAAAISLYRCKLEDFIGQRITDLNCDKKEFPKYPEEQTYDSFEAEQCCFDGSKLFVEIKRQKINIRNKVIVFYIVRDITQQRKKREEMLQKSYQDRLTGLYNRMYYEENINKIDCEQNLPLTVVMMDVNGLKLMNDAFGHYNGDKLIASAADAIKKSCRLSDVAVRYGGDEFLLLLPNTSAEQAKAITERIKHAFKETKGLKGELSISMGFATKSSTDENLSKVFNKADENMYAVKLAESEKSKLTTIQLALEELNSTLESYKSHSENTRKYAGMLAREYGLDEDDIQKIEEAAFLHDIGKVGIDHYLLDKAEKQPNGSHDEVRRHAEIGYQMLNNTAKYAPISKYLLEHHERWDGKGYPKELKGKEISLGARIISIADAFDTLLTKQSYRPAMTTDEALSVLERCSSTQFDANLVQLFKKAIQKTR